MFVRDETNALAVLAKGERNRVQAVDFYENGLIPEPRGPPRNTDTETGEP